MGASFSDVLPRVCGVMPISAIKTQSQLSSSMPSWLTGKWTNSKQSMLAIHAKYTKQHYGTQMWGSIASQPPVDADDALLLMCGQNRTRLHHFVAALILNVATEVQRYG